MLARFKVSIFVQCPACLGTGEIYVDSPSEPHHLGMPRPCRGCFRKGTIEIRVPSDSTDCPETLWEEALATLEVADIEHHEEGSGYVFVNGGWEVDQDLPSHRIARQQQRVVIQ